MTPPRRSRRYQDLADNLYWNGHLYVYKRPDGKRVSLGSDKHAANVAARRANERFADDELTHLIDRATGTDAITTADMVQRFQTEFLEARNYAETTLADYRQKLANVEKAWGGIRMTDWSDEREAIARAAEFVDQFPPRQGIRYKSLLGLFFRFCMSKGQIAFNPAKDLITKEYAVKRIRLTLEAFKVIREQVEPWFQHTMDLALHSLQRREDLVLLRFEDVIDGCLPVRQIKTSAHISIRVGAPLATAISNCRDEVLSPFIVHRLPEKLRKGLKREKKHHTQIWPEELSRAFRAGRDATDLFLHLQENQTPPTFHEIRALGAKLYEEAGIDPQPLLGHKDEQTTRIYLDRHKVEWIEAEGGIPGLDL